MARFDRPAAERTAVRRGDGIKTKNRDCWRYELEREGALKMRRAR